MPGRILCALLVGGSLLANPPGPKEEARELLQEGIRAFGAGQYRVALGKFVDAYGIFPSAKLLRNIAATYAALERPVEALDAYERFMREAGAEVTTRERAQVARELQDVAGHVGELRVSAPEGTDVRVDGERVGYTPLGRTRLRAGTRRVTMTPPGGAPVNVSVEIVGRHTAVVGLSSDASGSAPVVTERAASGAGLIERAGASREDPLARPLGSEWPAGEAVQPDAMAAAPPAGPPPAERPFYSRWPFWVGVGAVVVGGVVAGALLSRPDDVASDPTADDVWRIP